MLILCVRVMRIVVDNASTDSTCEEIRKIMSNAKIIQNLDNVVLALGSIKDQRNEFGFA